MTLEDFDWNFIDALIYGSGPEGPIGKWLPEMEGEELLSFEDGDKFDELMKKRWQLCKSELDYYDLEKSYEVNYYYFKDLINNDYYCLEILSSPYNEGEIKALYKAEPYTHTVEDFKRICKI